MIWTIKRFLKKINKNNNGGGEMKNAFDIVKENGDWKKFEKEIEHHYRSEKTQRKHIRDMKKFLSELQVPEEWKIEFDYYTELFFYDMFIDLIVENEKNENILYLGIELDERENKAVFLIHDIIIHLNNYKIELESEASERDKGKIDFTKLISKREEFKKLIEEVMK